MNRPQKDVGITYLLWLLLGVIGAHKFYLGRPGMGVLYLLTLGIVGIGLLVDLFTIPAQVRRYNAEAAGPMQLHIHNGPMDDTNGRIG